MRNIIFLKVCFPLSKQVVVFCGGKGSEKFFCLFFLFGRTSISGIICMVMIYFLYFVLPGKSQFWCGFDDCVLPFSVGGPFTQFCDLKYFLRLILDMSMKLLTSALKFLTGFFTS